MGEAPGTSADLTVLVVDDEEDLRDVMRRILERRGFAVLTAANAQEAIAIAAECTQAIDVVLSDLTLPGTPARDMVRTIVETRPGVAVVYISGTSRNLALDHGLIEADSVLLQKPFTTDDLVAAVTDAAAVANEPVRAAGSSLLA